MNDLIVQLRHTKRWNDGKQRRAFLTNSGQSSLLVYAEAGAIIDHPVLVKIGGTETLTMHLTKTQGKISHLEVPVNAADFGSLSVRRLKNGKRLVNTSNLPMLLWMEEWDICAGEPGPIDWLVLSPRTLAPGEQWDMTQKHSDWVLMVYVCNQTEVVRHAV